MLESLEAIEKLIKSLSTEEQRKLILYLRTILPHPLEQEWGIDADTILSAIRRSSDLTKRGVRGIIAEAVFEGEVIPKIEALGWKQVPLDGDLSYDALLRKGSLSARIQIKLQRLENGAPKLYYPRHYKQGSLYVVEVQRTRSGIRKKSATLEGTNSEIQRDTAIVFNTRPYRFGDFDVLAVNMHPSSGNWKDFRYTLSSWLLSRPADESLIEIFQPVAAVSNDLWTDDLATCLAWLERGEKRRVLSELLHLSGNR